MYYEDSICFSTRMADELNEKAFSIDNRLFLFAYYKPKKYQSKESFRANFLTAIVNVYGLLKDCCPFLENILNNNHSILLQNRKPIKDSFFELNAVVCAFRSIFCHNNSEVYPLNREKYDTANQWLMKFGCDCEIFDNPDANWKPLLDELIRMSNSIAQNLSDALDALLQCPSTDTRRQDAIENWIAAIARCYLRNPDYLLNALVSLYEYHLHRSSTTPTGKNLRKDTKNWLSRHFSCNNKEWYTPWLDKSLEDYRNSKVYALLTHWPSEWANFHNRQPCDCDCPPLPAGDFFFILATDVYTMAKQPYSYFGTTHS